MAGNNAIQFLRGSSSSRSSNSTTLLAGQPFYETDTNRLYVGGNSGTTLKNAEPIGLQIQSFWEGIYVSGSYYPANRRAWVGERSFIELKDGNLCPAICVDITPKDSYMANSSTWQFSIGTNRMTSTSTKDNTGWGDTNMYTYLNIILLDQLPSYMQSRIKSVTKTTGTANNVTDSGVSCKLWVPSIEEIFGPSATVSGASTISGSTQFKYYANLLGSSSNPSSSHQEIAGGTACWLRNRGTHKAFWSTLCVGGNVTVDKTPYSDNITTVVCFQI